MPEEITSPRATSYEAPRDVPTCGRHDPDRVASSRVVDDNALDDDDGNSDYNEYAVGTDDEADSGEEPDKGMSDSEEDGEGDKSEDEDDAPEESLPAASNTRAGRAKPAAPAKTASKGGDPPRRAPKTRNHMPVKRSVWSLLESTIFVAARWFMEDELESLLGKQGSQYWARLINHLEKENPGWVRGVNAVIPYDATRITCELQLDCVRRLPHVVLLPVPFHPFYVYVRPINSPNNRRSSPSSSYRRRRRRALLVRSAVLLEPVELSAVEWSLSKTSASGMPPTACPTTSMKMV
ncbi:unnamed protein product [Closterium sp. NIES-65]|nr:unnamed protein product [Closterium sp. NIES-65]